MARTQNPIAGPGLYSAEAKAYFQRNLVSRHSALNNYLDQSFFHREIENTKPGHLFEKKLLAAIAW